MEADNRGVREVCRFPINSLSLAPADGALGRVYRPDRGAPGNIVISAASFEMKFSMVTASKWVRGSWRNALIRGPAGIRFRSRVSSVWTSDEDGVDACRGRRVLARYTNSGANSTLRKSNDCYTTMCAMAYSRTALGRATGRQSCKYVHCTNRIRYGYAARRPL